MVKELEQGKNIIMMIESYYLKENIYITIEKVVNFILKEDQNMKGNFYMIKNGMEKDMMKQVIQYMN